MSLATPYKTTICSTNNAILLPPSSTASENCPLFKTLLWLYVNKSLLIPFLQLPFFKNLHTCCAEAYLHSITNKWKKWKQLKVRQEKGIELISSLYLDLKCLFNQGKVTWLWWIAWNLESLSCTPTSSSHFLKQDGMVYCSRRNRKELTVWANKCSFVPKKKGEKERTLHRGDFIMAITISMAFTWTTFKLALQRFPNWSPRFFSESKLEHVVRMSASWVFLP